MMLEKIVEQYGVEEVVAKTKISKKNLEKLMKGDFSGMTRPQAYGFLKILQREFGESEFDDLKSQLDAWFLQAESERNQEIFIASETPKEIKAKRWIVIALGLVVVLTAFYLAQKEFVGPPEQAQQAMEKSDVLETLPVKSIEKESSQVETEAPKKEGSVPPPLDAGDSLESSAARMQNVVEENTSQPYVPLENAVITPHVKLWLGVIDLKTKKRSAKVTDSPYEIDSKGKRVIVTGHGRFEISDAFGNLFKFNDAKKHYFLIDDGMVKEIDFSEFKRLTGGKGW